MTAEVHPAPGGAQRVRELITPEGVDLRIVLAEAGQRAGAFLIDAFIIVGVLIALTIVCFVVAAASRNRTAVEAIAVVWILGSFLLRNFYFIGYELGPKAATPGKRMVGLRVAARNGGRLTADAIFARNAMREVEVYLPLSFLVADAPGIDAWITLAGIAWCAVFVLFPLFNRDRLRAGDLVAGTWVVLSPRRRLLKDPAERAAAESGRFAFTTAQLDAYGVKELQVLEDVLRRNSGPVVHEVAARIRTKIGWAQGPGESDWDFLDAYYAGLRGRLEAQLLLGRRRRDKHDRP